MLRACRCFLAITLWAAATLVIAQEEQKSAAGAAAESEAGVGFQKTIIQSGDTLFAIAQRFNTTVEALAEANAIAEGERIVAGQELLIPAAKLRFASLYEVQPGDTLYSLSKRFNTSVGRLQLLNGISDARALIAGRSILVPSLDEGIFIVYTVQADDTLFSISRQFGAPLPVLKSLNGIADEIDLRAGQTILLPRIDESAHATYVVTADDTLFSIARLFATSEAELMLLNGLKDSADIEVGQTLLAPRVDDAKYVVYVVQSGDTLFGIARLYNTTVAQLRSLNDIEGGDALNIGQGLVVPRVDETILERYIVQPGDSIYSIAKRYGIAIPVLQALNRLADIRDIQADQALLAPALEGATLAIHVIETGDTLEELAERYDTTVALLQSINGIVDPGLIVLDQTILVPVAKEVLARPGFGFGVQVFVESGRADELALMAKQLGADWVKIDVAWSKIETARDIYSYSALDNMMAAMALSGFRIMLNVYDAPDWSRRNYTDSLNSQFSEYSGPPENIADFAAFLANLVTRYAGLVGAYEIWKSPNLVKFWTVPIYTRQREMTADGDYGIPDEISLGAEAYVDLLKVAYDAIKSHDEEAMVITAGLAPAGFGDSYNAIDTVTFLNNMLLAGAADYSDAIGAIFSASAVPPTLKCCEKPPGVGTHYESFLQYYGDLLAFYDETLKAHNVELPIIVTQLGWGTTEGANLAVAAAGFEWLQYTSEDEQALYVRQAYKMAQRLEFVSSIFLYNLNGCAIGDEEACFFSMVDADGRRRPVFGAYASIPKSAESI